MASGQNTVQYRKMLKCTPTLTDVLADGTNTVRLAGELVKAGLINKANERKMMNTAVDAEIRAAELISMVTTKVGLNSKNFDTFVEVLEKDEATYGDIVIEMKKLDEPPQPYQTPPPQTQTYALGQQKQAQVVDIPKTFTTDMSKELLALWLSHHQKLVGDYDDDINILKGAKINGHSFLSLSKEGLKHLDVSFGFSLIVLDIIKELKAEQEQSLGNQNPLQLSPATNTANASATTHTATSTASVPSSQPGPYKRFGDEDHNVIYSKLADHADRWLDLGTALGFKDTELTLIQTNPMLLLQSPPRSYLRQMLSQWLQWGPGDGRGSSDFANSVALYRALLKINLAPVAYELDVLFTKH